MGRQCRWRSFFEHRAAAAHAEAEAERTAFREVRNRSESGPAPSAMLHSDPPTVSAPEGAPPPGRPQRKISTKVLEASEPTENGSAEPKPEDDESEEESDYDSEDSEGSR